MTYRKIALVDVDGVLLNWIDAFLEKTNMSLEEFLQLEIDLPEIAVGMVNKFNCSAAVGFLKPWSDNCLWGVRQLFESGYELHAITSFGGDIHSRELRKQNINRYYQWNAEVNMISSITFTDIGASKEEALLKYGRDSGIPFIEDHLRHAITGAELGFTPFLLNRSYNQNKNINKDAEDKVFRCRNWSDIVQELA
tara:strand:- start:1236 stop:1820 length:585 start_codon:yes stop_codon:yes gene_type:complete